LKNTLFRIKHLRPPSPKRPVAETASPKCPRPRLSISHSAPLSSRFEAWRASRF